MIEAETRRLLQIKNVKNITRINMKAPAVAPPIIGPSLVDEGMVVDERVVVDEGIIDTVRGTVLDEFGDTVGGIVFKRTEGDVVF